MFKLAVAVEAMAVWLAHGLQSLLLLNQSAELARLGYRPHTIRLAWSNPH